MNKRKIREFNIWRGMFQRCNNPQNKMYKHYGGRGIKICERWNNFDNFLQDVGKRPSKKYSIDRINNDGNYEPKNCRWATQEQQHNNKRPTRKFTWKGKTQSIAQWQRELGLNRMLVYWRLKHGMSFEEAVTQPVLTKTQVAEKIRNRNLYTFNGKTQCVADWAKEYGFRYTTLVRRINVAKEPFEKALRPSRHWIRQ